MPGASIETNNQTAKPFKWPTPARSSKHEGTNQQDEPLGTLAVHGIQTTDDLVQPLAQFLAFL